MAYVTVHDAKTTLSKLLARVLRGEEIVIARGSEPVARLVPLEKAPRARKFGALRGKLVVPAKFFDQLPDDELKAWER